MANWTTKQIPSQVGKVAVVTGATGGLGYETALALAIAGAEVIVAGRNEKKGAAAIARIKSVCPAAHVRFEKLDLANLKQIEEFAAKLSAEGKAIDILVNNAGVMALPKRQTTSDGFEMQFGTNHLGHFALTARLLPLLIQSKAPRVVNVSSMAHRRGAMNFNDLQAERKYVPWVAYCQSKLANLLFTFELQRKSDANGWGLMCNAAHPGFSRTDLIDNGPGKDQPFIMTLLQTLLIPTLSQTAAEGALPQLLAATSPNAKKHGYYGPNGFMEMKGAPKEAFISARAKSRNAAVKLWQISESLTHVSWPEAEKTKTATETQREPIAADS